MNQNKDYPDWFFWMYEKGPVLFILGGVFLLWGVIGIAWYHDHRVLSAGMHNCGAAMC